MKPWRVKTYTAGFKRVRSIRRMTRVVPFTNVRLTGLELNKNNPRGRLRRQTLAAHLRQLRKWLKGDNDGQG
jgi:hypothetical protein